MVDDPRHAERGRAALAAVEWRLRRLRRWVAATVPLDQRTDLRHRFGRHRPWEGGFDLTAAPPCPPGEATGPPDFVGVGVPEAGCQWWFAMVAEHPAVTAPPTGAEARHVLSHFASRRFGPSEVDAYHRWFPRRPGTQTGEWTPTYLGDPWVAPLLRRACPQARILVMVRDPVVRAQLGLVQSMEHRRSNAGLHTAEAIDRGFYAAQLRWLLDWVPREQVLVLQYERCAADPGGQLAHTYRFLGLDPSHRPPSLRVPIPRSGPASLGPGVEDRLTDLYAADVADLSTLVPSLDLSLWPRFDGRVGRTGGGDATPGPGYR